MLSSKCFDQQLKFLFKFSELESAINVWIGKGKMFSIIIISNTNIEKILVEKEALTFER